MQCFLGCSSLLLYGVAPFNGVVSEKSICSEALWNQQHSEGADNAPGARDRDVTMLHRPENVAYGFCAPQRSNCSVTFPSSSKAAVVLAVSFPFASKVIHSIRLPLSS